MNFGFWIFDFGLGKGTIRKRFRIEPLSERNPKSKTCTERGRRMQNLKWGGVVAISAAFAMCGAVAQAQQPAKVPRIGVLWPDSAPSPRIEEFRQGLRDLGYVEGQNMIIEYRYADGRRDRLPALAAELVHLKVQVIVALSTLAAVPAKKATTTVPIVTVSGDPIGTGLIASLARPGGNVTGLSFFSPDLVGKRLELLKEVVPRLSRVAILWDVEGPAKIQEFKEAEAAAPALGLQIQSLGVRAPNPDLDGAFQSAVKARATGLLTLGNPLTLTHHHRIVDLAIKTRLPSMYDSKQFVEAGGLMTYGPNFSDLYRRSAVFVDKILKGAKPAELPVEQPTKFELVINLKTAKQIGLTIPPNVLARADRVIK
jgi:putative ABC transport system substrate-binding protein